MVMALMLAAKIGWLMVEPRRRGEWAQAPSGSGLASGGSHQPNRFFCARRRGGHAQA
jgi:hypothetical protein